jgi:hypothetical protein
MHWHAKSNLDHSAPYITGNGFASYCAHIWNYDGYVKNPNSKKSNWIFIKTDYVQEYFKTIPIQPGSIVWTHNSDYSINESHLPYLDNPNVSAWFAQNPQILHSKLKAIPIGLGNSYWPHGDVQIVNKIFEEENAKDTLFYANYSVQNNPYEREQCRINTGVQISQAKPFEEYLRDLSRSYFCISPKGNGIDCHRTWESLYVRTIPVVTRSQITDDHRTLPMVVLNDWAEFNTIEFTPDLYNRLWHNFDVSSLYLESYLKSIF